MFQTLRNGDGFGDRTPHLREEVVRLQKALLKAGFQVANDGLFGKDTEAAVRSFQEERGLKVDGVVGPKTWRALRPRRASQLDQRYDDVPGFETFHGDLSWIHRWEGHAGTAYWPGGRSGVTLDPGYDLGFHTLSEVKKLYGHLLTRQQLTALDGVLGLHGQEAKEALATGSALLNTIRVGKREALRIMPQVAVNYWTGIESRFPVLGRAEAPWSVQTALLSLAYNRGPRNRGLGILGDPLTAGEWLDVADRIGSMQQDHRLPGIRARRRAEADLIRSEMDFGQEP